MLTVLLGGARSGKSAAAERWGRAHAGPVAIVATGEPLDPEMRERIDRHRADRPADWQVIEEPLDLTGAIEGVPRDAFVIVDCLTTWLGNVMFHGLVPDLDATLAAITDRPGRTVVISNEVGCGIVPADPGTRGYRDELGRLNQRFVAAATDAYLLVAGRALRLDQLE
ncbi:MAG TPA: bifunctional adenosylcobinamide kinase/adenosylcobinamide-phosphate guanylyltransferase [Ilumatobacter sp.]|nr:bifunctional adenosylcobinamide kinase/adenosylcobinamide-phosphate guanylyltransferase [Ilumatobacter sp.]